MNEQEALGQIRRYVDRLRRYAKANEILLWALALSGLRRKKRKYALTVYASAIFLLLVFMCNGSRKALAERLSYKSTSSIGQWLVCLPDDPIEAIETRGKEKP